MPAFTVSLKHYIPCRYTTLLVCSEISCREPRDKSLTEPENGTIEYCELNLTSRTKR